MLFSDVQSGAEFLTKPSLKIHRSERPVADEGKNYVSLGPPADKSSRRRLLRRIREPPIRITAPGALEAGSCCLV